MTGPREVKAADIQAPSDVEVVNPDLYLCTLDSNKGRLRMELTEHEPSAPAVIETLRHVGDALSGVKEPLGTASGPHR